MNLSHRKGLFEDFFERRSFLIMQYNSGDITKREFLEYNYEYLISTNAKPFIKVDSYEKGMYNYQYYNSMAKYYRMLAKEVKYTDKRSRYYNYYLNMGNKYYHEKDQSILELARVLNFENIICYFIKCDSEALKNTLYEIVFTEKKEAIFHSKAIWLLNIFKENNCFIDGTQNSLIDEYINERY